jgi:phenylacetate-CoA ligase
MTVKVERKDGGAPERDRDLAGNVSREIKKQVLVSASVEVLDHGSLPRSERKSQRVFDNREF